MSHASFDGLPSSLSHGRAPVDREHHEAEEISYLGVTRDQNQTVSDPSQPPVEEHSSQGVDDSDSEIVGAPNETGPGRSKTNGEDYKTKIRAHRLSKDLDNAGESNGRDLESQERDQAQKKVDSSMPRHWTDYLRPALKFIDFIRKPEEPEEGYSTPSFRSGNEDHMVPPAFHSVKILIMLRLVSRYFWLSLMGYQIIAAIPTLLGLTFIAWIFRYNGIYGLNRFRIPSPGQIWKIWEYPQRFWESLLWLPIQDTPFWWTMYLLLANIDEFEQNFINAWRNRAFIKGVVHDNKAGIKYYPEMLTIFIRGEYLKIPMFKYPTASDEEVLEQLRMWYKYFKIKRGLFELLTPRSLSRIDCVKIEGVQKIFPGTATQSLDCGRDLVHFYHPRTVSKKGMIENTVQNLAHPKNHDTQGLEFVRRLNRTAVLTVVLTPSVLSAVAIIVWLSVYLRKSEKIDDAVDVQAVTNAAFTIAAYLVTAGAFVTALAAYFDSVQDNDKEAGKIHWDTSSVDKYAKNDDEKTVIVDKHAGKDDEIRMLKLEIEVLRLRSTQQAEPMAHDAVLKTQQETGLINRDNDCFALASLQCLSNFPNFVQACRKKLESTQDSINELTKSAILLLEALYAVNQNGSADLNSVRVAYKAFVKELKACKDPNCTDYKIPAMRPQDANLWLMWFLGPSMLASPATETLKTKIVHELKCANEHCKNAQPWSNTESNVTTIPLNSNGEDKSSLDDLFLNSGFREWTLIPDKTCSECRKPSIKTSSYIETCDHDIIIQLVRGDGNNQKSNASVDFNIDQINLPIGGGKTKGFYVRALEHHESDTKDNGHYKAYLRKDMDTRIFDQKNDDKSKSVTNLDEIVNHRVYLLYCSPIPVVKANETTAKTTSKEKPPSLLKRTPNKQHRLF